MLMSVQTPMVAATISAPTQLAATNARAKTAIHSMLMDTLVKVVFECLILLYNLYESASSKINDSNLSLLM